MDVAERRRLALSASRHEAVDREEERLCDFVAAELLMPPNNFADDVERRSFGGASIRSLAVKYDVSLRAAARRVLEVSRRRQAVFLFERKLAGWDLRWSEAPRGAVSPEGVVISPSSSLAQRFEDGSDFRGRFTLFLGPVADEYPVDAVAFGSAARGYLLMVVSLGSGRQRTKLPERPGSIPAF